jgi:hypothetical protein
MRELWRISDFGRAICRQLRFGDRSRAPVRLLRLEWRNNTAECDWLARPADEWDRDRGFTSQLSSVGLDATLDRQHFFSDVWAREGRRAISPQESLILYFSKER